MKDNVRQQLFRKLKKENCFWSYDISKMKSISDEALIEHVMLYLDIEDIDKLFPLFGFKKVKRVWLDRVAPHTGKVFETSFIICRLQQRIEKLERIQRLLNEETETKIKM